MKLVKGVVVFSFLLGSSVCASNIARPEEAKCPNVIKHFVTHLITGGLSQAAALVVFTAGRYYQSLEEQPSSFSPLLIACLIGFSLVYKTPEWTDKYLLGNDLNRTCPQKILTSLHRLFLFLPGIVTGEICHTDEYLN